jgi:molybdopterin-biosynthesis enzyme MoeA-like protein
MKEIISRHVLPRLQQTFELQAVVQRTALTHGIPEAELARRLEGWEKTLGRDIYKGWFCRHVKCLSNQR